MRVRNSLVVGVVAAVAAFAVFDVLRGGDEPSVRQGPEAGRSPVPSGSGPPRPVVLPPGELSGTLWLAGGLPDCRLQAVALAEARVGTPGPATGCDLSVAPDGRLAVVSRSRPSPSGERSLWLVRLEGGPALVRSLGRALGAASWSADSRRVAWCDARGTVVLDVATAGRERLRGCRPRFGADGSVLTRPDRPLAAAVWRDGRLLLGEDDLRAGFGGARTGPIDVLAFDEGPRGILAVGAAHFPPGRAPEIGVQLWRDGEHLTTLELPGFGSPTGPYRGLGKVPEVVDFSPDGSELAVASVRKGRELRLFAAGSWEEVLRRGGQTSADWSPDGSWLVLAVGDELLFVGPERRAPVHVLPLDADALAWRR